MQKQKKLIKLNKTDMIKQLLFLYIVLLFLSSTVYNFKFYLQTINLKSN